MIKLRYYQEGSTPAVINYLRNNKGKNPLVAMPTGSGKTVCIADLINTFYKKWDINTLVLSHVKEILEQDCEKISEYTGEIVGVNSAMLKRREVKPITVASIQSVYKNPHLFNKHKLIIVDEAHTVSRNENSMYRKFFSQLSGSAIVGFTATPFRLGDGYIYGKDDDLIFDDVCYDYTSLDKFNELVKRGYLSPLITKATSYEMDVSDIKKVGGDYSEKELSSKFNRAEITEKILDEVIAKGKDRKRWLIFAIDISHAEQIAEYLLRKGVMTGIIHSEMNSKYGFNRDSVISNSRKGFYRSIVNVNILTTGYDDPEIDLIAVLRPTESPVLHVQMLGRGSRIYDGKANCLVLDFACNIDRLGPINDVVVKKKGKGAEGGDPIVKTCPGCGSKLPPAVRDCPDCGHHFEFIVKLSINPTISKAIDDGRDSWLNVESVEYSVNKKFSATSTVIVSYNCPEIKSKVREVICVEHKGFAKQKADHWIKYRGGMPCNTVDELIAQSNLLSTPRKILVGKLKGYLIVKDAIF